MIMSNTFREKLNEGKPTIGTHYLSSDPDLPEIIGDTGLFDYAEFSAEYTIFDFQLLFHMARSGQCSNLPLLIKLDQASQTFWAQAALGAGFKSILFTDIRTVEDVSICHQAIRPDSPDVDGHMGVKLRRPFFGETTADSYLEDLNNIVFMIMIEKGSAVDNLDAVLSAAKEKGVDMTQWGPADYSVTRGNYGSADPKKMRTTEELVIRKSLEYGIHPRIEIGKPEQAKRYIDLGVRHFCMGWDRFIYEENLVKIGEGMRKLTDEL